MPSGCRLWTALERKAQPPPMLYCKGKHLSSRLKVILDFLRRVRLKKCRTFAPSPSIRQQVFEKVSTDIGRLVNT